ncbi:hypothetical protein KEJ39_03900 [Candidatus Bathyarchaeota archaeon]|nr:hypothetical protein [Candidatus Bathyarchaeota archaeon]
MERVKVSTKLAEFEERQRREGELRLKAEKAAYTTLEEIVTTEPKIIEIYVPDLDRKIKVQPLTVEDYIQSLKYRNQRDETGAMNYFIHMLKCTWGKCDPTVTEERLRKMSLMTLVKIMSAIPVHKLDATQDPFWWKRSRLPRVPPRAARTS